MSFETDAVIAGGGLNGSALALALAGAGMTAAIVEPTPPSKLKDDAFDGRGYALALSSMKLLDALGLWERLSEHAQPILDITVSDGRAGEGASPLVLEFDHAEIEEGPMGYMIEDRYLRRALLDEIESKSDFIHRYNDTVTSQQITPTRAEATLADGPRLAAHVLIGCDGRRSKIAEHAGIKRVGWGYGQTALVCAVDHELPHKATAHQFFMPPGPLAILPLPGNKSSIVWTESDAEAQRIQALDDAAYLQELRPRFGDFLGDIKLAGHRFTYPLNLTLAQQFVAQRVALVGDAAHGVHPIAGQGLNAGLKDVAALAEVLALAKRRGEDIGQMNVLERYQQWRRFDATRLALATDGFNRLFSNDNTLLRLGRDIGLGLVNSLPGLRRTFIREAAGLTGDLPKLLQGRPI